MAKKKTGLKDSLSLGRKRSFKKSEVDASKVDETANKIEKKGEETEKVPLKKLTIQIPESLYTEIKIHVARQKKTIKDYIIGLAEKDLGL